MPHHSNSLTTLLDRMDVVADAVVGDVHVADKVITIVVPQCLRLFPLPPQPAGVNPPQRNDHFSNIVKTFANQNVCYSCGFDVKDWHTSATCNRKKQGHQDGFTRTNYMEYKRANHPFCRKAMHKTMYPRTL